MNNAEQKQILADHIQIRLVEIFTLEQRQSLAETGDIEHFLRPLANGKLVIVSPPKHEGQIRITIA